MGKGWGKGGSARRPLGYCMLLLLLVFVILLSVSFETLSPLEAGVKINSVTAALSADEIFTAGRYYLGIQYKFITYPTNILFLDFSRGEGSDASPLRLAASGGQVVEVELSIQVRLMVSDLVELYRKYETNYIPKFVTIAETTIKNLVAELYEVEDYFTKRPEIADTMHKALNQAMQGHYAVVESLVLRNVVPKETLSAQILANAVAQEQEQTTDQESEAKLVRSGTNLIKQALVQEAVVVVAQAERSAKIIVEGANAQAIGIRLNATAESYKYLQDELNYTSPELLKHLFFDSLRSFSEPDKIAVDVDTALFNM